METSSTKTVYAVWAPVDVTITFVAVPGTCAVETAKQSFGEYYNLPTPTPPTGYKFTGWKNGETAIQPSMVITSVGPITLTAQYAAKSFVIVLDAGTNYGVVRTTSTNNQDVGQAAIAATYDSTYGSGSAYSLTNNSVGTSLGGTLPTATRTGYTTRGWYTEPEDGVEVTAETTVGSEVGENNGVDDDGYILYAQYNANFYEVILDLNDQHNGPKGAAQFTACSHNWTTTAATCEDVGKKVCSKCNETQITAEALGHDWQTTVSADCTTNATVKCSRCNAVKDGAVATGHTLELKQALSCTTNEIYKCSKCTYEETTATALGHDWELHGASCTAASIQICKRCLLEEATGAGTGHSWIIEREANCISDQVRVCSVCGENDTIGNTKAFGHDWATNSEINATYTASNPHHQLNRLFLKSSATCQQPAIFYYSCGRYAEQGCLAIDEEHTFTNGTIKDHYFVDGVCTWCGIPQDIEITFDPNDDEDEPLNGAEWNKVLITVMQNYGGNKEIEITASSGTTISTITANGEAVTVTDTARQTYTFENVISNCTLEVVYTVADMDVVECTHMDNTAVFTSLNSTQHTMKTVCRNCGYVISETTQNHELAPYGCEGSIPEFCISGCGYLGGYSTELELEQATGCFEQCEIHLGYCTNHCGCGSGSGGSGRLCDGVGCSCNCSSYGATSQASATICPDCGENTFYERYVCNGCGHMRLDRHEGIVSEHVCPI